MKVKNEKELGEALKSNVDVIEVEYDLKAKVLKLKGIGDIAWGICIAAMTVAVMAIVATTVTAGTAVSVSTFIATPALASVSTILGMPTTVSAVSIAVAGGGVASLNKLRDYKVEIISADKIRLVRL